MNLYVDISIAWPELFVAITAMLLLMFGVFQGNQSARLISWLAVGVMFIAAMLGGRASSESVHVLAEMGLDLSGHETQPLTEQLVRHADEKVLSLLAVGEESALWEEGLVPGQRLRDSRGRSAAGWIADGRRRLAGRP